MFANLNIGQMIAIVSAIVVALIIGVILFIKYGWFRKLIYKLVVKAEVLVKENKQGQVKKEMVVNWVHEKLPATFQLFITKDTISKAIDKAVEKMNKFLKAQAEKEE